MQPSMSLFTAVVLTIGAASAQYSSAPAVSTITVSPGCPSAAPDVMVTRSAVVVPSCAGNETKPTLITMSGYGDKPSATATGGSPQFTGAAGQIDAAGAMAIMVGGAAFALLL